MRMVRFVEETTGTVTWASELKANTPATMTANFHCMTRQLGPTDSGDAMRPFRGRLRERSGASKALDVAMALL